MNYESMTVWELKHVASKVKAELNRRGKGENGTAPEGEEITRLRSEIRNLRECLIEANGYDEAQVDIIASRSTPQPSSSQEKK